MQASGIYQIQHRESGKRYIGSAVCIANRFSGHRSRLSKGKHHNRPIQNAWNKYGEAAFDFSVLIRCSPADLLEYEQRCIDGLRPEYNICLTAGNTLGVLKSADTREKIRRKAIGRKRPPRGPEYRAKLSAAHAGKAKPSHVIAALQAGKLRRGISVETRAKVSESLRLAYSDGRKSKYRPEEYRNKIGKAFAKLSDDDVRMVRMLRASGSTGKELAERFNSNAGTISAICKRKRYRWVA